MVLRKMLWVGLLLLASAASAQAQNLVANGGFETGDFSGWTRTGNQNFMFVTTAFDGIAPHGGSYQAVAGPQSAVGSLSQSLATQVGKQYDITFWVANYGLTPNSFDATFGGNTLLVFNGIGALPYTEYTYTETATAPATTLQFDFQQPNAYWYLDDVSVEVVPESSTISLLVFGGLPLLGLVFWRSRRARKGSGALFAIVVGLSLIGGAGTAQTRGDHSAPSGGGS